MAAVKEAICDLTSVTFQSVPAVFQVQDHARSSRAHTSHPNHTNAYLFFLAQNAWIALGVSETPVEIYDVGEYRTVRASVIPLGNRKR